MSRGRPVRILQVIGQMHRGGAETWLMHVLRRLDRQRFHWDFLVHTDQPCAYDDEIRALGSRLLRCLHPQRPWLYARNFRQVLREHESYDVVHSHVHDFSGTVLRLARRAGIPVRIAHSHNDTRAVDRQAGWARRLYVALMRRWIARHATIRLACSQEAGVALFGPTDVTPWQTLYCGVDLEPFRQAVDRAAVRAELGLPADAFVLGHVGRFMEQKNHTFLLRIAAEASRREARTHLLLVGEGPLRPLIERQAAEQGLSGRVDFAGQRPDVPRLMRGAMDVFVLPSLHEGLPLVGMEVQAAGLPLVMTDTITPEVDRVPGMVHRLPLAQPPSAWAEAILAARRSVGPEQALALVEQSPFNIQQGVKELERLYGQHAADA